MCCVMLLFSTMRARLHHSVSVDHLPDQLHCVVQQFCSPDLSPGFGFSLFKLSQQVTGSQSAFRQRLLHPGNINSYINSFVFGANTVTYRGEMIIGFAFLPFTCAVISSISQLNRPLKSLLHKHRSWIHCSWNYHKGKPVRKAPQYLVSSVITSQKSYLRCCQILCSVKHAQGRKAGQEPVQAERRTPETRTHLTEYLKKCGTLFY